MYEDGLGQWVVTLQDTATPDIFQVEMCATENQARDLFLEMAFHIMDANKR
jgi:hypothetical protein